MPYYIKCHKVCQYGYQKNCIEQTNRSMAMVILKNEKRQTKMQKAEIQFFCFYFSANSFVKNNKKKVGRGPGPSIWKTKSSLCSAHKMISILPFSKFKLKKTKIGHILKPQAVSNLVWYFDNRCIFKGTRGDKLTQAWAKI